VSGDLLEAIDQIGGTAVITADHGNSDQLVVPETGGAHTAHTLNPVELVIYGAGEEDKSLRESGCLGDIAPTHPADHGPEATRGHDRVSH
jgi:2,3-bisphosphoglycerate-independent phosphoglycerate mutase